MPRRMLVTYWEELIWGVPVVKTVKNLPAENPGLIPWVGKISWRKEWQPTAVFLPEEFHGQRKLASYSPRGHREANTTESLTAAKDAEHIFLR